MLFLSFMWEYTEPVGSILHPPLNFLPPPANWALRPTSLTFYPAFSQIAASITIS